MSCLTWLYQHATPQHTTITYEDVIRVIQRNDSRQLRKYLAALDNKVDAALSDEALYEGATRSDPINFWQCRAIVCLMCIQAVEHVGFLDFIKEPSYTVTRRVNLLKILFEHGLADHQYQALSKLVDAFGSYIATNKRPFYKLLRTAKRKASLQLAANHHHRQHMTVRTTGIWAAHIAIEQSHNAECLAIITQNIDTLISAIEGWRLDAHGFQEAALLPLNDGTERPAP